MPQLTRASHMRLLIITREDIRNPEATGYAGFIRSLAGTLVSRGHEVSVLCGHHRSAAYDRASGPQFRFTVSADRRWGWAGIAVQYLRFLRLYPFDCVIEASAMKFLYTPLYVRQPAVLIYAGIRTRNRIFTGPYTINRIHERLAVFAYRKTENIALTDSAKDYLVRLGMKVSDVIQIPMTVKSGRPLKRDKIPTILIQAPVPVPLYRKLSGIRKYRKLIVYTLEQTGDGIYRESVILEDRKLTSTAIVNPTRPMRHRLLQRAWIQVIPEPTTESVFQVAEAGSYRLPTLTRDEKIYHGVIMQKKSGMLSPPESLAGCVIRALTDGRLRSRLSAGAFSLVKSRPSGQIAGVILNRVYNSIPGSRSADRIHPRHAVRFKSYGILKRLRGWYIRNVIAPQSLLDIGCGQGDFVSLLREHGVAAWGVDVNRELINRSYHRFRPYIRWGNLMNLKYPDKSFDVVSCIDVLEHLKEKQLVQAIAECARIAKRAIVIDVMSLEDVMFVHSDPSHVTKLHWDEWLYIIRRILRNDWTVRRPYQVPFANHAFFVAQRKST